MTVAEFPPDGSATRCSRPARSPPKIHNHERVHLFVARYGHLPIDQIGREVVSEWLGRRQEEQHGPGPARHVQ